MPLDVELGKTMLQLITSRYDDRHWRKKIEKTLGLPQSGVGDPSQQQIFMYLKLGLKAYKSRRADPDSWIVGGYATKEIVERAKFQPQVVGPDITKDEVAFLGIDPGKMWMKPGGTRCWCPGSICRKRNSRQRSQRRTLSQLLLPR